MKRPLTSAISASSHMFTFGDIRNIAVQIEQNGEATYRRAGKKAASAGQTEVAEILYWMADQEQQHAAWFSSLHGERELTPEQKELEQMGKSLLQEIVKDNPFLLAEKELEKLDNIEQVLNRSRQFEEDTIVFFEFLQTFLDDALTVSQMQRIIREEQEHIRKLDTLLASVTGITSG